jgi:tetratricopeptide (TPR) repeat protein
MANSKFITSVKSFFKPPNSNKKSIKQNSNVHLFFTGEDYFNKGFQYYKQAAFIKGEGWKEKKRGLNGLALQCFDKAFNKGYKTSKLFALRADCLDDQGYYFDAIEDYNKTLSMNPTQGIASSYWKRGIIKHTIFDFEGSRDDLITAITLSKLDNEDNRFWNEHTRSIGFGTATELYKWDLEWIVERSLKHSTDLNKKEEFLKNVKRRS